MPIRKIQDPLGGFRIESRIPSAAGHRRPPLPRYAAAKDDPLREERARRERLLSKKFCPEGIQYLWDVLGIDLRDDSVSMDVVDAIADGCMTPPVEVVLYPAVWDREAHASVPAPPVKAWCSLVVRLPRDPETFVPVPPSADRHVYIASYPCRPYLQRVQPGQEGRPEAPGRQAVKSVTFDASQKMALEGIGIRSDRLYAGCFNSFTYDERLALSRGGSVDMLGVVRVSDPFGVRQYVSVSGQGRLVRDGSGGCTAEFLSYCPAARQLDEVLDIVGASRMERLELDIFERDAGGRVRTDANGRPFLNAAGRNLVDFGVALGPVGGWTHTPVWDAARKRNEYHRDYACYSVSVVNGNLCATRMSLAKDAQGVERWVVPDAKVRDGKVRVGGQNLSPASPADLEGFVTGRGGFFSGFSEKAEDKGDGYAKLKAPVRRDVFVVPDNRNNGFARPFTAAEGIRIAERLGAAVPKRKVQDFSIG